jgi:hypothetical protein
MIIEIMEMLKVLLLFVIFFSQIISINGYINIKNKTITETFKSFSSSMILILNYNNNNRKKINNTLSISLPTLFVFVCVSIQFNSK